MKNNKKSAAKSGMFSRILVLFCIGYCVRITEWGMTQFEMSNTEASTLITAALALFGGELLLLCLKRVFSNVDFKMGRKSEFSNASEPLDADNTCG